MDGNERIDRLEELVKTIAEGTVALMKLVDNHDGKLENHADELAALRELSRKNEEHLGVVIKMMDDWIRTRGRDKE